MIKRQNLRRLPSSRVERNAPRRVRPPPRQTVRAVFPHTAFHVELILSRRAPFPHLVQSHCLPLVVIRLRIFQLVPPLACMLREDDEPLSHVIVHPQVARVGISTVEVIRPPLKNDIELLNRIPYRNPTLTTVRQPYRELAQTAMAAMLQRLRNPQTPPRQILLDAPLVVRASSTHVSR